MRASSRLLLSLALILVVAGLCSLLLSDRRDPTASAAATDVYISGLSCDGSPESVRVTNYGPASESLVGFHLQSDPNQDYDLGAHVNSIQAGQTLEFQSGSGAVDNPAAGIYKLTGSNIYRNGDPTDYARLARSDSTAQQVNCGSTPATPTLSPSPSPSPTPTAEPTPTPTPPGQAALSGDVDCNRNVDAVDALFVLRFAASLLPAAACISDGADINCDAKRDAVDALGILRYVASVPPLPAPEGCPAIGAAALEQCGAERWLVKTLADDDVASVNFSPQSTTVSALRQLARPGTLPETGRIAPTELTVFTVQATVLEMKLEDDHDFHVVIADPQTPNETMIVEIADTGCPGAIGSAKAQQMKQARADFVALFGQPTTQFQPVTGLATIAGVGFFDYLHGQHGVAPNGIELHPVLGIAAALTSGAGSPAP